MSRFVLALSTIFALAACSKEPSTAPAQQPIATIPALPTTPNSKPQVSFESVKKPAASDFKNPKF